MFAIVSGFLFFFRWLLSPILKIAVRLNRNRKEYNAVVKYITQSLVSNKNNVPNKSLRLEIVETGEMLTYETNGKKVPYNVGDKVEVLVAFKTWIIK